MLVQPYLTDKFSNFPPESTIAKTKSVYLWKPGEFSRHSIVEEKFCVTGRPDLTG
jgi:hypothetical protein